jgi:DNA polymerase-3 subunit epsilon
MSGYTVVDFETTGFSPRRGDRVVEVGVAYVSPTGVVEGHWSTLVNPQREVGATHVHGITAADVLEAPTFDVVAPYLVRALAGRVFVAHNARFDRAFLEHELARAGMPLAADLPTVCTMQWAKHFLTNPKRTLADCCATAGVDYINAHTAEADTLATAELLACYLRACHHQPPWTDIFAIADTFPWPIADGPLPPVLPRSRQHDDVAPEDTATAATSSTAPKARPVVRRPVR